MILDVHGPADRWNGSPEVPEDDHSLVDDHLRAQEASPETQQSAVRSIEVTTSSPKTGGSTQIDPPAMNVSPQPTYQEHAETAGVQNLPLAHVTVSQSPPQQPSMARSPPSSESNLVHSDTHAHVSSARGRQSRRRSAMEPARSNNRLSGFFSNLIHRRDTITAATSRLPREERPTTPVQSHSEPHSRAASPVPTRSSTPPPPLPAPTLHELGLSLSATTSDLSPSHFSSPPTSGAFLAPHYLLLCHAQGLDVLPLVSPPASQPYALVRRVAFKSVVVMEHRRVLVAIAGRRDGVRVYALEEVKKAVEWRIEVEVRREHERTRRKESKKTSSGYLRIDRQDSSGKRSKLSLSTPPMAEMQRSGKIASKSSSISSPMIPHSPRPATLQPLSPLQPIGQPPPYTSVLESQPPLRIQRSTLSVNISRSRRSSLSFVVPAVLPPVPPIPTSASRSATELADVSKNSDWIEASDDEAIDVLTAGASGSQALDERTSSIPPTRGDDRHGGIVSATTTLPVRGHTVQSNRRSRPANLDLTLTRSNTVAAHPPDPLPSPTLLTIRRALQTSSPTNSNTTTHNARDRPPQRPSLEVDPDEEDDDDAATVPGERITLVQALLESRLPDLPPAGTTQPQDPVLIQTSPTAFSGGDFPAAPSSTNVLPSHTRSVASWPERRRRRWSILGSIFNPMTSQGLRTSPSPPLYETPLGSPVSPISRTTPEGEGRLLTRSLSNHARPSATSTTLVPRPSTSGGPRPSHSHSIPPVPMVPSVLPSASSYRLLPRILSNAFSSRRSNDRPHTPVSNKVGVDSRKYSAQAPLMPQAPSPKLEYVKLPGTKGSLMIKAVETPKKSFLAILCGENGEKVELFAGTYRTALGLSRTFILPDSPKSLELQLQGDDLVEVFLVFSQNVFGLEPATVRVREVRIGRAERRAARRRVREIRNGQTDIFDTDPLVFEDEDTNVNLSVGIPLPSGQDLLSRNNSTTHLAEPVHTPPGGSGVHDSALAHAEELVVLASAQVGPYTTFQQLSFAPKFPLASIADEYIIPPTYPDFLGYRAEHEPDAHRGVADLASMQFNPPGLPMPAPAPPSKWCYRDPKGVTHGPWKANLMQAWYRDGMLPPDLPVRKEEEEEYILLKDLRQQCVDPVHPFRSAPPPPTVQPSPPPSDASKPLLPPISLLLQPRHFGPPPLFYSSRGGHSTSIVDARGRSVIKGRFMWSADEEDNSQPSAPRMGDVKRLEAFDVRDRSIIVAMRQGGLEAMDFGDALLKPADESRTALPSFLPPPSNMNRRGPFVWKIGTPISSSTGGDALFAKAKTGYLGRKASYPTGKSPAKGEFAGIADGDAEFNDEIIFIGRNGDDLYLCERNGEAFRILRLRPDMS
ncbi:hypothetical protein PAXRUDRAFT_833143 [Paxillus rubicundulus Ve08.2h10]|uniref:GYF domain-containing protein n=1 Tax=Paxillus rubicundulus Ve08.2h10 TaxID=930991 RepID=A0A0D0DAQ5_9AGAM|nr:hypothetical protein PAXRUDRAFT_833143 [Paxillus rubicundulus Ve08.2h10]